MTYLTDDDDETYKNQIKELLQGLKEPEDTKQGIFMKYKKILKIYGMCLFLGFLSFSPSFSASQCTKFYNLIFLCQK